MIQVADAVVGHLRAGLRSDFVKIESVRTYLVHAEIPDELRVESGAGRKFARQMCLIVVETDDGLTGYGSPSGPYDLAILERLVQSIIGPYLIGSDPRDTEYLWHQVFHGEIVRNVGHRSVGVAALSGVDTALWDLKAKSMGVPLYQLLGGRYHLDGVRCYASSIYWDLSPIEAASLARKYVEDGFSAVKLKVGREPKHDALRLQAIRDEVGSDVAILVDANQSLDRYEARAMLALLEDLDVYWFEEPLSMEDIEGHRQLRNARRSVRIATGENLYTRSGVMEYLSAGAVDVIQADASRVGGVSEARKIADIASANHVDWNPHTFSDSLTVLANLHLVAASPHPTMFEWDVTHNDLMTKLTPAFGKPVSGRLHPPEEPGLGAEIDMDFVKSSVWDGQPSIGPGHGMKG